MAHCPSQDWDQYADSMDNQAQAEIAWWRANQDRVITIAAAILSNPNVEPLKLGGLAVVDAATAIVLRITRNAEPIE